MSSLNRSQSWTAAALEALNWLRPLAWGAIALVIWFAVVTPALADPFPWPPPNAGCPPNTSCIPGGPPGGGNPGQCTANPNGNPGCGGAGNPVDIITGNKYQHEIDLAPLPGEMGLHFSRHYNSNSTHRGLTGVGWRSSFEVVLVDLGSAVQIIDADGRRLTFDRQTKLPGLCVGARLEDGRVLIDEKAGHARGNRSATYRWQRLDGSEYVFSGGSGDGHPLQSIRAATGATTTLTYRGGALDSVRDPQGRALRFIYSRPLAAGSTRHRMLTLAAIETPVGRITYKHDENGRLLTAVQPNGLLQRYHYEAERQGSAHNIWALTGISAEWTEDEKLNTQRVATYSYDSQGRAIHTQHVGGDDLKLTYGPRALTTLTAADGSRTSYRHALVAGQWKTVEADGPGCKTCPPSNIRYRFRTKGALAGLLEATLRVDGQGKPLEQERIALDSAGRPTQVERIVYGDGKPQKANLVLRAEYQDLPNSLQSAQLTAPAYASFWRPTLVARPSVVAGREHTIAITYNMHLQPLAVTERGFSPIDSAGNFSALPLSRTTSYRYAPVGGASRLAAIDGALSGPADTTTLHYDQLGRLRLIQYPVADLQERFSYDEAGRVVWHMPVDAVERRTSYPAASDTLATSPLLPASVTRAQRSATYAYNARGWLRAWVDGPRSVILNYNAEGRVVEARDERGSRVTWNRDEAKKVEATLWFEADQSTDATAVPRRSYFRWFDSSDRTVRTLIPDGRVETFSYDARGRLTQHFDGNGVAHLHLVRRSGNGSMQARIDWAPDDQVRLFLWNDINTDPNTGDSGQASAGRRLRDDFGRVVRADLPEHGVRIARHDEGDRITHILLPDGVTVDYQHDHAGRMINRTVTGTDGAVESVLTQMYYGAYLIEVIDPAQRTVYRYDSAGRKIDTQITLAAFGSIPASTYSIGTVFDARGEAIEHRLADGRHMTVSRDPATTRPIALSLRADGLKPSQPIISGITAHPFNGVTSLTHGNGVVTTRTHDSAGRLAVLKTSGVFDLRYDYQAGPRIRAIRDADAPGQNPAGVLDYDGFGALRTRTLLQRASASEPSPPSAGLIRANLDLPDRVPERDARGRLTADDRFSYGYDALDRLITVHEIVTSRLVARYTYNAFGERVGKTTFDTNGTPLYRQFLYQGNQLVAEISIDGATKRIERQYVYLNNLPVAMLEASRVLAIHTDHRGAPLAMTDQVQRIVWRATYRDAWGEVQEIRAPSTVSSTWKEILHTTSFGRFGEMSHGSVLMQLRLPGQYADEETGLHYNMHRYYDPRARAQNANARHGVFLSSKAIHGQGRYLTPDPLGHPDGPDPYLYASGDPVNKTDPAGLYQIDVHYYVTFFLAIAAGMRAEDAQRMALATQFIDDNPATRPVDYILGRVDPTSVFRNQQRLLRYHFVFSDLTTGQVPTQFRISEMSNPDAKSAQLQALYRYAVPTRRDGGCNFPDNESLQFMGEYLHAFEDTFAHRDRNNIPYNALNGLGWGVGHGLDGEDADYTYNHETVSCYTDDFGLSQCATTNRWQVNENRTIAMEEQVYGRIVAFMNGMNFVQSGRVSGRSVNFSQVGAILRKFNAVQANDSSGRLFEDKIAILNGGLRQLGFDGIDMTVAGIHGYDEAAARRNRHESFDALPAQEFPNAILETR